MKNKLLLTVTDKAIIDKFKGNSNIILVYPLTFFCVGLDTTFTLDQITEDNSYLFINRVCDTKAIEKLKQTLNSLPNNIKGIIFDDLGVLNIVKDLSLEKVLYLSHFNTNYESINYFNEYVDSVIVSTDITNQEIDEIISKSIKPVSLFTFGLVPAFYSRRTLITSFNSHYNKNEEKLKIVTLQNKKFYAYENEFGTVIYNYPYFNGLALLNKKVKYNFYFPAFLNAEQINKVVSGDLSVVEYDDGFLNKKTIYKLPPKKESD